MDALLGETLAPARVSYEAARRDWEAWLDANPVPMNAALDARLADPGTRAGFVPVCRARGLFHIPTVEFVTSLARTLARLPGPSVEIGAGRGILARAVRAAGVPLIATDDGSWWPDGLPDDVARCDLAAALDRFQPGTVLCVWPPRGADWPAQFRAAPSVRAYLLIGDGPHGLTGSGATWNSASGWRRSSLPALAACGRCRLDADGPPQTQAMLVRRTQELPPDKKPSREACTPRDDLLTPFSPRCMPSCASRSTPPIGRLPGLSLV